MFGPYLMTLNPAKRDPNGTRSSVNPQTGSASTTKACVVHARLTAHSLVEALIGSVLGHELARAALNV